MPDALATALVAAGSSLLTIVLTPRLQHVFWRYQRRAELRLAVINEFNRFTSEFLTGHISAPKTFKPSDAWFASFSATDSNIRAMFSDEAVRAFKELEVLIGPGTDHGALGALGKYTIQDFVDRKNRALQQLYREVRLM